MTSRLTSVQTRLLIFGVGALALLLALPFVAAAKEFALDGTVDCGSPVRGACTLTNNMLPVLTTDISGSRQRVMVNVSWLKGEPAFSQDDLVCFRVETRPDGGLQAVGFATPCPEENLGNDRGDRDKDDDDDDDGRESKE